MRISIIVLLLFAQLAQGQSCDCKKNFDWLRETLEQNDAGYKLAVDKKGSDYLDFYTNKLAPRISQANSLQACSDVLNEWLDFFRKGHLVLIPLHDGQANEGQHATLDIEQFKQQVAADEKFIDGIWEGNGYQIAIRERQDANVIEGIVIESEHSNWKKGDVKFITNYDFYRGEYFAEDKRKLSVDYMSAISTGVIQLHNFYFKRTFPEHDFTDAETHFWQAMETRKPLFTPLNEEASYMRIPSFSYDDRHAIDEVIKENQHAITNSETLIIDLRGNLGGSDLAYLPLLPLLYTNPIVSMGTLHYSTELNNASLRERLEMDKMADDDKEWYTRKLEEASQNLGAFIDVHGRKYRTTTLDSIFEHPSRIYILIDNFCASTTEQFLLAARQSSKVKIVGVPSAGALDVSNLNEVLSPTQDFKLIYATSKSLRLPTYTIDDRGIQPDYFMHDFIAAYDWVDYVLNLHKN